MDGRTPFLPHPYRASRCDSATGPLHPDAASVLWERDPRCRRNRGPRSRGAGRSRFSRFRWTGRPPRPGRGGGAKWVCKYPFCIFRVQELKRFLTQSSSHLVPVFSLSSFFVWGFLCNERGPSRTPPQALDGATPPARFGFHNFFLERLTVPHTPATS